MIGEAGVLIRGPSGSGKSSLALRLILEATRGGRFARLVGDDRVSVAASGSRLIARPHPALAGLIERRTLPLATVPHEPACVVRLVVELVASPSRLPEPGCGAWATLDGIDLPLVRLEARNADVTAFLMLQVLAPA